MGWTVILVLLAIIGMVTSAAQSIYGDTAAYVTFFGLVALIGLALVFYVDKRIGLGLLLVPAIAVGAAIVLIALVSGGYGLVRFFEEYGILGAIFLALV
ncbi:hypothetical protein AB4144_25725, partial [Rhizobiaceae sp. 2RAB30]